VTAFSAALNNILQVFGENFNYPQLGTHRGCAFNAVKRPLHSRHNTVEPIAVLHFCFKWRLFRGINYKHYSCAFIGLTYFESCAYTARGELHTSG
jgi:hypothetical protein